MFNLLKLVFLTPYLLTMCELLCSVLWTQNNGFNIPTHSYNDMVMEDSVSIIAESFQFTHQFIITMLLGWPDRLLWVVK